MEIQQYFYLIGTTILLPVWILLFSKKDKRKDMIIIGLCFGICGVIIDKLYASLDYWSPVYIIPFLPLEDFYYGFIFGGISAEIYELLLFKRNSKRRVYKSHKKLLLIFALVVGFSFWFVVDVLRMNSIIAHIIPLVVIGLVSIIVNREMWKTSIINALVLTMLTIFMFKVLLIIYPNIFINHWHLSKLSGIFFLSIPIEELLFSFAVGFASANAFEIVWGYKVVDDKTIRRSIQRK